jgi:hypothetical protein
MPSKNERRQAARAKAAADREEQQRRARRTRTLLAAAITVAVLAATAGVWAVIGSLAPPAAAPSGGSSSAPPWAAPTDVQARARAAGLSLLGSEGSALHIHQHLTVTVDGKPVAVPANIGIDTAGQRLSPLHTHDDSGILHVESPTVQPFRLGQFFTEWGVRLAASTIGPYVNGRNGTMVTVFVNGSRYSGPLPSLALSSKEDIAIIVTHHGSTPVAPRAFTWPSGY